MSEKHDQSKHDYDRLHRIASSVARRWEPALRDDAYQTAYAFLLTLPPDIPDSQLFNRARGHVRRSLLRSELCRHDLPFKDEIYRDHSSQKRPLIDFLLLREALPTLSPLHRRVISLTYERGLSQHEIGKIIHRSQSAVCLLHRQALAILRHYLEGENK